MVAPVFAAIAEALEATGTFIKSATTLARGPLAALKMPEPVANFFDKMSTIATKVSRWSSVASNFTDGRERNEIMSVHNLSTMAAKASVGDPTSLLSMQQNVDASHHTR